MDMVSVMSSGGATLEFHLRERTSVWTSFLAHTRGAARRNDAPRLGRGVKKVFRMHDSAEEIQGGWLVIDAAGCPERDKHEVVQAETRHT